MGDNEELAESCVESRLGFGSRLEGEDDVVMCIGKSGRLFSVRYLEVALVCGDDSDWREGDMSGYYYSIEAKCSLLFAP